MRRIQVTIYRAIRNHSKLDFQPRPTPRPPGNVPFYVDNIWEWLRPNTMPSRRHAAFASPVPEQAAQSAKLTLKDVFQVKPSEGTRFCQLVTGEKPEDAKYHADLRRLKDCIIAPLADEWLRGDLNQKTPIAPLFLPCSSKAEIANLMESDGLPFDRDQIVEASTFWQDVVLFEPICDLGLPHPSGEIFFEEPYRLIPWQR